MGKPIEYTDNHLSCEVCLEEIPPNVGDNAEAAEYVSHFFGLECFQRWLQQKEGKFFRRRCVSSGSS